MKALTYFRGKDFRFYLVLITNYYKFKMESKPIISIKGLVKHFQTGAGYFTALDGIHLNFNTGEFTGIVGPSGSGKTTLLNIIGSLDSPSKGEVDVLDRSISSLSHKQSAKLRNCHIGFIFQTYNLLPVYGGVKLPAIIKKDEEKSFSSEREILYKILFDMKSDMNDLKKLVLDLIRHEETDVTFHESNSRVIKNLFREVEGAENGSVGAETPSNEFPSHQSRSDIQDTEEIIEESFSLSEKEVEMINKALAKYNGKRKMAAKELGISERTLYRKIKEYGIES